MILTDSGGMRHLRTISAPLYPTTRPTRNGHRLQDAVSHDEKRCLARRNRTKSSDRSHPREGGRELVVKKEQIESPRRREDSDREWSRTRHGAASNGLRRLAPGQVFDAFRERSPRSPWSPPLRRRRARADSDSETWQKWSRNMKVMQVVRIMVNPCWFPSNYVDMWLIFGR